MLSSWTGIKLGGILRGPSRGRAKRLGWRRGVGDWSGDEQYF